MKRSLLVVFAIATLSAIFVSSQTRPKHTFTGIITDSDCPTGDHTQMQMGPDNASCTIACVEQHGDTYLLYDGKGSFNLSDQKMPKAFAGKRATITGTLDAKTNTVKVESITAAK